MIVQYIWGYLVCTVLRRVQYIGHNQWSGERGEHVVLMMFVNYLWYLYQYINIRYTLGMYINSVCAYIYISLNIHVHVHSDYACIYIYINKVCFVLHIYIYRNLSRCFWKSTFSESPRTWFIKSADTTSAQETGPVNDDDDADELSGNPFWTFCWACLKICMLMRVM